MVRPIERLDAPGSTRGVGARSAGVLIATFVFAVFAVAAPGVAGNGPKPFQRVGKSCAHGQPCGELTSCSVAGTCRADYCLVDGVVYENRASNPSDRCQICRSAADHRHWSKAPDGTPCGNPTGEECISSFSTCLDGVCVPMPRPDGSDCGDGQVCCGGGCCGAGEICGGEGCEPGDDDDDDCEPGTCPDDPPGCDGGDCEPTCSIDGMVYGQGATDPARQCWGCDPTISSTDWSPKADNASCGANDERFCCNGECCGIEQCCGGLSCTFDFSACFPEG